MVARLAESLMAVVRFTRGALVGERLIRGELLVEHRIPVALVPEPLIPVAPVAVVPRTSIPRRIRAETLAVDILRRPAVVVAILVVEERPGLRRTTVVASTSLRGIAEASQG
jgi:hypothetical protein